LLAGEPHENRLGARGSPTCSHRGVAAPGLFVVGHDGLAKLSANLTTKSQQATPRATFQSAT
jgi:hypothetical protein